MNIDHRYKIWKSWILLKITKGKGPQGGKMFLHIEFIIRQEK